MKNLITLLLSLSTAATAMSQAKTRIEITHLPEYHSAGSDLYLAGSFNGWNAEDNKYRFQKTATGDYYIDLQLADGDYEYKITRGGWDKTECKKGGGTKENRLLHLPADSPVKIDIEEWADRFPAAPRKSTASANVKVIDTAFLVPQLKRVRRIWIYLPEGYAQTKEKYPVLYMHDGQNVFDDATSFSGEWGVDEYLDSLKKKCIVVAVDNGGTKRLNEYCPYDMKRFGKGEGNQYVDFLVNTLKPFIDTNYRTLQDQPHTWIAGSSMGGLISMYAVIKYPEVFGGAGIFSPSFWIAPAIFKAMEEKGKEIHSRLYFYAGDAEGDNMVEDMQKAITLLQKTSHAEIKSLVRPGGKHNEERWRQEFPLFYEWISR